jgi:signal transduction histidine kinase/CheY-like chemotaxis protein
MDSSTYAAFAHVAQSIAAVMVAGLFFMTHQSYQRQALPRRRLLLSWCRAWLALAVLHLSSAAALTIMPGTSPDAASRMFIDIVGILAVCWQLAWLAIGIRELLLLESPTPAQVLSLFLGITVLALVLRIAMSAASENVQTVGRLAAPTLLSGVAILISAFLLARRGTEKRPLGVTLLAVSISAFGLKEIHDAVLTTIDGRLLMQPGFGGFSAHLDILIQVGIALSVAAWVLGEERAWLAETSEALRASEEQLRHSQKLEAVGQLAGGIAHDFNNIITSILGYADMARRGMAEGDLRRSDLDHLSEAAQRGAGLTNQLLAFSRKQMMQPQVLDLNTVVGNTGALLTPLVAGSVDIRLHLDERPTLIEADPGQIAQILLNLAINARDAVMEGAGTLDIRTANVTITDQNVTTHAAMPAGRYVLLEVRDNGTGIDPAVQGRVFEPFFTTKEPGRGTGLGLSTVYGIVKQSGGNITLQSAIGQGSTFRIYLPAVTTIPAPPPSAQPALPMAPLLPKSGPPCVLLVEDDELLLPLFQRALVAAGCTPLCASEPSQALEFIKDRDRPIHLLVTDVIMPEMSGVELYEEAKKIRPELKALFVSGYPVRPPSSATPEPLPGPFLAKPFAPQRLTRVVRALLEGRNEISDAAEL